MTSIYYRNISHMGRNVFLWILSNLLVLVFGSFATYSWSHHIHPIWADIVMSLTGEKCCFKATDPISVSAFAGLMTDQMDKARARYIVSFSPEAAEVKIAAGTYDCQETYLDVVKHVLSRNSGNLRYETDLHKKSIHIMVSQNEKSP
jgi:hypothetical protein